MSLDKTQEETQEERRNAERRADSSLPKRIWRRNAHVLAYLALAGATTVAVARGEDARHQIAQSGTAATTIGCNRDFRSNQRLRSILVRGYGNVQRQYESGVFSKEERDAGRMFYIEQIKTIELPDCRDLKVVASGEVSIPTPLYPGSEFENKARPGEKFQPLPNTIR